MKIIVSLVVIFVLVQDFTSNAQTNGPTSKVEAEDKWIWGDGDSSNVTQRISQNDLLSSSTSPAPRPNPCNRKPPQMPNFSAPGRRLSQVKCYEYVWDISLREAEAKRNEACQQYNREQNPDDFYLEAVGGRDAETGEFPHMGAIGWKAAQGTWIFKCGGSLISTKFVLTAAHCSQASSRDFSVADVIPKIVRLGDKNIIDTFDNGFLPTDANILKIINHPEYKAPKKYFDIALIELESDVAFTNYILPACLYVGPDDVLIGRKATLTGWGVVETVNRTTSPVLQAAVVDVMDNAECDKLLRPSCNRNWCGVTDSQLCAGKLEGGVDACQGDSGGPLQMKISLPNTTNGTIHQVIGVTSFGIGCALPNLPGIYTKLSFFLDWIEKIVWN